jgi:hypothetical protein
MWTFMCLVTIFPGWLKVCSPIKQEHMQDEKKHVWFKRTTKENIQTPQENDVNTSILLLRTAEINLFLET